MPAHEYSRAVACKQIARKKSVQDSANVYAIAVRDVGKPFVVTVAEARKNGDRIIEQWFNGSRLVAKFTSPSIYLRGTAHAR